MNDSDAVMAMLLGVAKLVRSTKMLRKVAKVFSKDLTCPGYWYSFQIFICVEENCDYFHWAIVWEL